MNHDEPYTAEARAPRVRPLHDPHNGYARDLDPPSESPRGVEPILAERSNDWSREWLEPLIEKSMEKGRAAGQAAGRVEGRREGLVDGLVQAVLRIVEARFGAPDRRTLQRLATSSEADLLDLITRAATAERIDWL